MSVISLEAKRVTRDHPVMARDENDFKPKVGRPRRDRGARVGREILSFQRQVTIAIAKAGGNPKRLPKRSQAGGKVPRSGRYNARGRGAKVMRTLPRDTGWKFDAASGQKLLTVELKPDVNSPFTVYYQSTDSVPAGSAFVYTQPFIIKQGTVNAVASVTVTLANSAGTSQPMTAQ